MTIEKLKQTQGLTNDDIVNIIREEYPKFNKSTLSMAMHPQDYGVKLLPKCSKGLNAKFSQNKPLQAKIENNRLNLRLDLEILSQLKSLSLSRDMTVSALVNEILMEYFNENAGRAE